MKLPWLNMNNEEKKDISQNTLNHYVLGTSLTSQINDNDGEIVFGCGCFWGAEKGYWKLPGVVTTAVGYAGGHKINPTYQEVCSGTTGHTEVVRVTWNKTIIDISDLLKLFWECHDPTQGNRQGNDSGSQYRSAIYVSTERDLKIAIDSKIAYQLELSKKGYKDITTEIKINEKFYFAEKYHQQYLAKPGSRPYCSAMPTNIILGNFPGSNYKLDKDIWDHFDWSKSHCVLRSDNNPIKI